MTRGLLQQARPADGTSGRPAGRVPPSPLPRTQDTQTQTKFVVHCPSICVIVVGSSFSCDGSSMRREWWVDTPKRISPPLPKIMLCAAPTGSTALPSQPLKCKKGQPDSGTACLVTVTTQPGMLRPGTDRQAPAPLGTAAEPGGRLVFVWHTQPQT